MMRYGRGVFRLFLLFLVLFLAAFKQGDEFQTADGTVYVLEARKGTGDFAEVWKVKQKGKRNYITLKFFKKPEEGKTNSERVKQVVSAMAGKSPGNILRVQTPIRVTQAGTTDEYDVIPAELGVASAEQLAPKWFDLNQSLQTQPMSRRVTNVRRLLDDMVSGAEELYKLGFTHHDLNPRNIIQVGNRFKIGDLDGATPIGHGPPLRAAERSYMAIEYSNTHRAAQYGPLSDLNTIGNTVYYSMFGRTPIGEFAEHQFPETYERNRMAAIKKARRLLFQDEPGLREAYDKMIQKKFAEAFERVPKQAALDFGHVAKWVTAALTVDPKARQEKLLALIPSLAQLKATYPIEVTKGGESPREHGYRGAKAESCARLARTTTGEED